MSHKKLDVRGAQARDLRWVLDFVLQVILYSFPAVCWIYGAGTIFSLFVSVVFWGPLLQHVYESLRKHTTIVRPMGLEVRAGVGTGLAL